VLPRSSSPPTSTAFDGDMAECLVRLNQRSALGSSQVRIGLDGLNDLGRPVRWLIAAE